MRQDLPPVKQTETHYNNSGASAGAFGLGSS